MYNEAKADQAYLSGAKAPEPATTMASISWQIENLASRIVSSRQRLTAQINALIGDRPEGVGTDTRDIPYCITAQLQSLQLEISLLEEQIDRLF